jgi:osmotically-inducible protein OsmY
MTNAMFQIDAISAQRKYSAIKREKFPRDRPRGPWIGRWFTMLLILAGAQIPLTPPLHAATTPKAITDHGITSAVERGLLFEKGVFPSNVDVSTSEGIVTINVAVMDHLAYLSGSVASNYQKGEAQDVASRTKGVISVLNHLKVEPEFALSYYAWPDYLGYGWPYYDQSPYYISEVFGPQAFLSDEQIKKSIEDAFFWSPFVHSKDIKVAVDGGVATLTGSVGTWIGRGEADKDARRSGATTVLNRVKVKTGVWWW